MGDKIAGAFAWLVMGLMTMGIVGLMMPFIVFILGFFGIIILLGAVGWVLGRILA